MRNAAFDWKVGRLNACVDKGLGAIGQDLNQLKAVESIENRSASTDKNIEWSTVSKAALRSNKTKRETLPLSMVRTRSL